MLTATPSPHDRRAAWRQASNPFASRYVRPAAFRYRFDASNVDLQSITTKILDCGCNASLIVGPHGTGKSTLLHPLAEELEGSFTSIQTKTLRSGQSARDCTRWALRQPADSMLIVDGFEQLDALRRCSFLLACRLRKLSVLATSHTPLPGFQVVHRTRVTMDLAKRLTSERLAAQSHQIPAAHDFIDQIWADVDENLRELWFAMYDWYQAQSPPSP